jgi:hypothetical protein
MTLPKKTATTPKKLVQAWCNEEDVLLLQKASVHIPELIRIAIKQACVKLKKGEG